jgi:acyl-coenzyme A synthetase/AMP-(fatty) acid ligase
VHERLARFKMPRDVIFVERLPRNATGKALKRALARYDDVTDDQAGEVRAAV